MDTSKFDIYILNEESEKALWKDCIFVFDSSALLDLYFYPEETRQGIYNGIFKKIKERLWLPSHVQYEYFKNRKSIIKKPISEKYRPLIDGTPKSLDDNLNQKSVREKRQPLLEGNLKSLRENFEQALKKIQDLKQRTKNKDKHPHVDQADIEKFEKALFTYGGALNDFYKDFKNKIEIQEKEILKLEKNDTVLENLEKYFTSVGKEYTFQEILKITEEGKLRYEFNIPPGYMDLKDKKKEGTQIFGDLIIWKQILEFAKEKKNNIVFICNDFKEDWCVLDAKATEKRVMSPRAELIKEFNDISGKRFWMYGQDQFIFTSNKLLKSKIPDQQIEQISQFITEKTLNKYLVFKCNACGDESRLDTSTFYFDYETFGSHEREMGPENHYEAREEFHCPYCNHKIVGSFNVWEYPAGVINDTKVNLDGAQVIRECRLDINFYPMIKTERQIVSLQAGIPYQIFVKGGVDYYNTLIHLRYNKSSSGKWISLAFKSATGHTISQELRLKEGGYTRFQFKNKIDEEHFDRRFGFIELTSKENVVFEIIAEDIEGESI